MDLSARAAYIKGLMEGMEYDTTTKEGKLLSAMLDLLEEMADVVTEHDNALDQVYDELDAIDEDMDELEETLYDALDEEDEDDEEDEGEDAEYELTCPQCGTVTVVDEATLLGGNIVCPGCGADIDIQLTECDEECDSCDAKEVCDKTED